MPTFKWDDEDEAESPPKLSSEQVQELEAENELLLNELNTTARDVQTAAQTIQEISMMQAQMMHYMQVQQERIETLHEDAYKATSDVQSGNFQLLRAEENFKRGRQNVVIFIMIASFVLLFLDWYG